MAQRYAHLSDAGLKKASGFVATMLDQAAPVVLPLHSVKGRGNCLLG